MKVEKMLHRTYSPVVTGVSIGLRRDGDEVAKMAVSSPTQYLNLTLTKNSVKELRDAFNACLEDWE